MYRPNAIIWGTNIESRESGQPTHKQPCAPHNAAPREPGHGGTRRAISVARGIVYQVSNQRPKDVNIAARANHFALYHRTPEKSTIVEDSDEECESDLYKQYSHLVYKEGDVIEGLNDKSLSNSSIPGIFDGQKAPNELVLGADDNESVAANQKAFKISRRRNLKS